ncbi:DUF3348 family protein [Limnohabitans sp.]|jgi:hypothetical protein|uniref:DUF3348 family protein n=1 Tax=Limnohabitans sp. TaxID=1907725 RepID=UPI0037C1246D
MTRPLPRAPFNSSALVRFLSENAMLHAARGSQDLGPRLGEWLNFRQAIDLHGLLEASAPTSPTTSPTTAPAAHLKRAAGVSGEALGRLVEKIRAQLTESIVQGAPPGSGLARIDWPPAALHAAPEPQTAFEPYRRFYAAHQRQMATAIHSLRAQVRTQLSQSTPALQQLAALDASFESILREREAALLGKVAKMLEKHWVQTLQALRKQPNQHLHPVAWLVPFQQHLRSALLAELDTRLQPTLGLLEAFQHATPPDPEASP